VTELPVPAAWAVGTGASFPLRTEVESSDRDTSPEWTMTSIEQAAEAARRYIIKRPRLTRLLDGANARILMLIAPAGFGKTTLAREWIAERPHVWYPGTAATADVAALAAQLSETVSEIIPEAGSRMVHRMRATGTPEKDVDILAELFAEDLVTWPEDTWIVFDDYQFAMEARAPERFVDLILRTSPVRMLLASRKRPSWATARRLLYGEIYELGRNELAMDRDEAAAVLAHRKDVPAAGLVALAEGWPAVIGLAALTEELELPEGSLPGALHDYFAEELYQAASPEVQIGLQRLALAPWLGDAVVNLLLAESAEQVVAEGVRLGFLSARSGAIEFHPLLRTFLDTKELEDDCSEVTQELARYFAKVDRWDEALLLLERFFSADLFVPLLEDGLRHMLADARLATLRHWLELAERKRVDAAIIDLAQAEIAFLEAKRARSEALAVRAARRLANDHQMLSRAFYIAGASAHMEFRNDRAKAYFERALDAATQLPDQQEAVWGELRASLDLGLPDVPDLLAQLIELDDGSAASEVRLVVARFITAIRTPGESLHDIAARFEAADPILARVTEPHIVSAFNATRGYLLALLGRYSDALSQAEASERYARDVRIPFVIGYSRRVKAMAELGLRHFSRCQRLIDWLDSEARACGDIFLELEARFLRSRLCIVQGLADAGVEILEQPPDRFPFEGERGEYLATLALGLACRGDTAAALELVDEAVSVAQTMEVRVLAPCVRAIAGLPEGLPHANASAEEAISVAVKIGNVDSFLVACRGYPALVGYLARNAESRDLLTNILERSNDGALAKRYGLDYQSTARKRGAKLSRREEEVLDLVGQGMTNRQIAKVLFISESTAKVHVHHILEKLGVRSRTEAAVRVADEGSPST
jgi:DNA-binding CsgD family transcriptional regulator/tetratricopeptide (TPR) repeat protein